MMKAQWAGLRAVQGSALDWLVQVIASGNRSTAWALHAPGQMLAPETEVAPTMKEPVT